MEQLVKVSAFSSRVFLSVNMPYLMHMCPVYSLLSGRQDCLFGILSESGIDSGLLSRLQPSPGKTQIGQLMEVSLSTGNYWLDHQNPLVPP